MRENIPVSGSPTTAAGGAPQDSDAARDATTTQREGVSRLPAQRVSHLKVEHRMKQLRLWRDQWLQKDAELADRLTQLDQNKPVDLQKATQITSARIRGRMMQILEPIEVDPAEIRRMKFDGFRADLAAQFAQLSRKERVLWLNNYLFIMTPDLRKLDAKIAKVRSYRALGQQRNFLLGGPSGMGKTTYLNWLVTHLAPIVLPASNYVPVVKVDAPADNTPEKTLLQWMILECGLGYSPEDKENVLLMRVLFDFQLCRTELAVIDEIQNCAKATFRRRVLDISNKVPKLCMVCASCEPIRWVDGDVEVWGRWNDCFDLLPYAGQRLSDLLTFLELLLPFPEPSYLYEQELPGQQRGAFIDGPARLIEKMTRGILRDIMILVHDASERAIAQGLPNLSPTLLVRTWDDIQEKPLPTSASE